MSTSNRLAVAAGALLIAATGAYWYWSPYMAMSSMQSAAEKQDADAFNQYVDYPKLRESLKGQFSAAMTKELGKRPSGGGDLENAGAALGTMLGLAFADRFIDAMVRPEVVMQAMAEGKLQNPARSAQSDAGAPVKQDRDDIKWTVERKGVDRVVARGTQGDATLDGTPAFVFDRSGFASWKLTEIRLPASK
jgi:hypothetical protein